MRSQKALLDNDTRGLVGVRGFEPPASASRTQRSTRLSHTPTGGQISHLINYAAQWFLSTAKVHSCSRLCFYKLSGKPAIASAARLAAMFASRRV